jgi:hypothetical protein
VRGLKSKIMLDWTKALERCAGVWQQCHEASLLDGCADHALLSGAGAQAAAAKNLAVWAHEPAESFDIFPIHDGIALGVGVDDALLGLGAETLKLAHCELSRKLFVLDGGPRTSRNAAAKPGKATNREG